MKGRLKSKRGVIAEMLRVNGSEVAVAVVVE
jgi:hypothetical protein